jgi:hypothetical protein
LISKLERSHRLSNSHGASDGSGTFKTLGVDGSDSASISSESQARESASSSSSSTNCSCCAGERSSVRSGDSRERAGGRTAGDPVASDSRGIAISHGTSGGGKREIEVDGVCEGSVDNIGGCHCSRCSALSATSKLVVGPGGISNVLNAATDTSSPLGVSGLA